MTQTEAKNMETRLREQDGNTKGNNQHHNIKPELQQYNIQNYNMTINKTTKPLNIPQTQNPGSTTQGIMTACSNKRAILVPHGAMFAKCPFFLNIEHLFWTWKNREGAGYKTRKELAQGRMEHGLQE